MPEISSSGTSEVGEGVHKRKLFRKNSRTLMRIKKYSRLVIKNMETSARAYIEHPIQTTKLFVV
jgi:hypothetical protein